MFFPYHKFMLSLFVKHCQYENENFSILPTEKIYRIQLEINDLLVELEKDHEKWEKIKEIVNTKLQI